MNNLPGHSIFWFGNEKVNNIVLILLHQLFFFPPTIASALKALENQNSDQKHEEVDISYLTGETTFTSDSTNKRESTSTSSSIHHISPDIRRSKRR
jgi:hypothetical protein